MPFQSRIIRYSTVSLQRFAEECIFRRRDALLGMVYDADRRER